MEMRVASCGYIVICLIKRCLRLLRATLGSECEQPQYIPCMYDAGHPSFAANEAKWDRYCTMLALEGFPVHLSYALTRAVDWLSSYETLKIALQITLCFLKCGKAYFVWAIEGIMICLRLLVIGPVRWYLAQQVRGNT